MNPDTPKNFHFQKMNPDNLFISKKFPKKFHFQKMNFENLGSLLVVTTSNDVCVCVCLCLCACARMCECMHVRACVGESERERAGFLFSDLRENERTKRERER